MKFEVHQLTGSRSGNPCANTEGYEGTSVFLGKEFGKSEVNMAMAQAEAVPLIAHNAIEFMLEQSPRIETQEELNLYAALLFTNAKAPVQIQHTHPPDIINSLAIKKDQLIVPQGLLKVAITTGLIWSLEKIKGRKKTNNLPSDLRLLIENLELMHDMTRYIDDKFQLAVNFEVQNGTLVYKQ